MEMGQVRIAGRLDELRRFARRVGRTGRQCVLFLGVELKKLI